MGKSAEEIQKGLSQPFAPQDLEWRIQTAFEDGKHGIAVPYVTNRAIQNRLDEVVGIPNWYNRFKPWHGNGKKESQICGISIFFEEHGFITKWDGAEDSDIESVKGGLSDSMKRAAVQWGIGRVLYSMDTVIVKIEKKGRGFIIKKSERDVLDKAYLDMLSRLNLTPAAAGGIASVLVPQAGAEDDAPKDESGAGNQSKTAGGKQSQSVQGGKQKEEPKKTGFTPAIPQKKEPAPTEQRGANSPSREVHKTVEFPRTEKLYQVVSVKVQGNMTASSTQLTLIDNENKRYNAFARGAHPALMQGAILGDVKLTFKKQDMVSFYILEEYRVVGMKKVPAA